MFDDLFGGLFDFNGDGHTDFGEEMLGLAIIDDIEKSHKRESGYASSSSSLYEDDNIGSTVYSSGNSSSDDTEEEIEERREELESNKNDLDYELTLLRIDEPAFDDYEAHEEWEEKVRDLEYKITKIDDELFELDLL